MALLPSCWLMGAAHPAAAAGTYTVTSTLDDGSDGTLRSAVSLANADPGATVIFGPGVSGVIVLQGAELDVTASMTILGPGAGIVQVDGGGALRLFSITSPTAQVALSGLALQNGTALNDPNSVTLGAGGGIYNGGTLALTGCTLTGSAASYGGGIYNGGTLALAGCTVSGNSADGGAGGGVYNGGALALTGCTLTGNHAFYAGALYNSGTTTLAACTVSANLALAAIDGNSGTGAGLYNDGGLTMAACVISGNTAYGGTFENGGVGGMGGGLYNTSTLALTGCTVSGNHATPIIGGRSSGRGSSGLGGGLENQGTATLTDDIFYADAAAFSAEIANDIVGSATAIVTATFCDIQGSSSAPGSFGPNDLDVDPLFVRPVNTTGPLDLGDLHLQPASPCVGAGIADPANAMDRDGNTRPNPPSIGAYQYAIGPPTANPQSVTTTQDTPAAITLTGSDPNSTSLVYTIASNPAHGTLSGTAPSLFYTPAAGYTGPDSFTFMANNGFLSSPAVAVSLTITPNHAVDVSGQVSVSRGGYLFNRRRNLLQQILTLTNNGPGLAGPVVLAFDGLPGSVAVFRPAGYTQAALPAGSPYLVVAGGPLAAGASVAVAVSYYDPAHVPAPYTPRVLAGNGD